MGTVGSMMMGFADLPVEFLRALHIKPSEKPPMETHLDAGACSSTKESVDASSVEDVHTTPLSSQTSIENRSTTDSVRKSTSLSSQNLEDFQSNHPEASSNPLVSPQSSRSPSTWSRGTSMAQTLGGLASRTSLDSTASKSPAESQTISLETAVGTSKGIGRIVGAGLKSPMDFTLSLARGFHNAPRLYGDKSVRHPDKVTGIQSGLRTAGKVRVRKASDYDCSLTNVG